MKERKKSKLAAELDGWYSNPQKGAHYSHYLVFEGDYGGWACLKYTTHTPDLIWKGLIDAMLKTGWVSGRVGRVCPYCKEALGLAGTVDRMLE